MTESDTGPDGSETESETDANESFRRHWETLERSSMGPNSGSSDDDRSSLQRRLSEAAQNPWLQAGVAVLLLVIVVGVVLYAVTGTWPVAVGVESSSMEPNIAKGDLVVLRSGDRSAGVLATTGGIHTRQAAKEAGIRSFGRYGSVIVFTKPGTDRGVIHRVHYFVEAGDNWVAEANRSYLPSNNCQAIQHCPAPNDGYITKGDANQFYDQVADGFSPVTEESVVGVGWQRIPLARVLSSADRSGTLEDRSIRVSDS